MTEVRPIISCRNLSKIYRMGDQEVRALDGVDLDIHAGEFVAIMGPSGSGKSSLMNLIGALDRPTSGEMWINGRALSEMSRDELADLRNETLGFVFQQFNLLARQDAFQNVRLPLRYARKDVGDIGKHRAGLRRDVETHIAQSVDFAADEAVIRTARACAGDIHIVACTFEVRILATRCGLACDHFGRHACLA
jgi:ABC-type lipoprotein export system ATPase subunit